MVKIAIATMTGGANYGNALQNYAVLTLIERCGYEAETLNITTQNGYPNSVSQEQSPIKKLKPSYVCAYLRNRKNIVCGAKNDADFAPLINKRLLENSDVWKKAVQKKQERFSKFQKDVLKYTDFEISNLHFNLPELKQYAAFVTGSDQVWNPYYKTNSFVEFLQFAPGEKRIAFAPSFGVSEIPAGRVREYTQWLSEIPYLSVREMSGANIIRKLTGREVPVLLDPTFGLTKDDWVSFARKPEGFTTAPGTYVFCYFLGNRMRAYTSMIQQYAEENHCQIIDVYDVQQPENYCYDPREFVWLLANAKAVFTDSFHGCSFSVNMQKPFVVFDRAGDGCITQSSRISTVLKKVGLEERKYERLAKEPINRIDCIDFSSSIQAVVEGRREIQDFLRDSLRQAVECNDGIHLAPERHCTGCGACSNACNKKAISMVSDAEGFLYPSIDPNSCVRCKACENVCPADVIQPSEQHTEAYYAFSKDVEICESSSSGGLFTELARQVIAENGVVFGAGFDEDFNVCHQSAETMEELAKLRTSKYVQSDTDDTYRTVKNLLKSGKQVMFSGTPCQIAALKRFLGKEYSNLLSVDIICHGVPSPGLWKKYLEQKHGEKKIRTISFRNKDLGWNDFSMRIDYTDGTYYRQLATVDPFEKAFLNDITLRPSCYQCQYKTVDRVSDITIADYWGVETVHPALKEQQGVSLVLIHSEKGEMSFKAIGEHIFFGETDLKRAISMNSALLHSVPWPDKRNMLFEQIEKKKFDEAVEICFRETIAQKTRLFVVCNGVRVKRMLRKAKIIN